MKKLVKILAAMTVAVATLAFVSCADGFANADGTEYTPETPAADDEPAAPAAPKAGTYYLNWSISNLDDYQNFMNSHPDMTISRVVTAIPAEEEGAAPTYWLEYEYHGNTDTVNGWKFAEELDIVDNTTSIDVTDEHGFTATYKPLTVLEAGTYELQSKTTKILGSKIKAPKTTTVAKDGEGWSDVSTGEKTATITEVTAATETDPAVVNIDWTDFEGNHFDHVLQATIEGRVVFTVDGDTVTLNCADRLDDAENTPVLYTYVFKKE